MTADELKSKYKYMFSGPNIGVDLYDGWMPILAQACEEIDSILGADKRGFDFVQIKEKYGSARYYFSAYDRESETMHKIQHVLDQAEEATSTACMLCGKPAVIANYGGWYLCLCDTHAREQLKKVKGRL